MSIIINNLDKIFGIVLLMSASLYFRILLQIMGQAWIKTIAHTSTLALLPILTYIITNVILPLNNDILSYPPTSHDNSTGNQKI